MSRAKLPYPPGPDPDDLPADRPLPAPAGLLAAEVGFFAAYLLVIALLLAVAGFCTYLALRWPLAIFAAVACLPPAGFLLKCFLRPPPAAVEPPVLLETNEDEQPTLWAFVRRLARDVGADEPRRVFFLPDVNAAVRQHVTPAALSAPPEYDLFLGLGLANGTTLSEFKFVLAHELAHAADAGFPARLELVLDRLLENMADGQDVFDRFLPGPPVVSAAAGAVRRTLAPARAEAARRFEDHADRAAAGAAGTAAGVSALRKTAVAAAAYSAAVADAGTAAAHGQYTADLYFHMHAAARTAPEPADADHPTRAEREEKLTAEPVPCGFDDRPAWLLFADPAGLRQRMTGKLLRHRFGVPKAAGRTDPRSVQAFLDADRQTTAFDPKYGGVYDDRLLNPGDLAVLNAEAQQDPWDDAKLRSVFDKLYVDAPARAAEWAALRAERRRAGGRKRRELDDRLDKAGEWFDSLDRRAYSVFARLAIRLAGGRFAELVERYRFQLALQAVWSTAERHLETITAATATRPTARDELADLEYKLREARSALKGLLRDSRDLDPPPGAGFDPSVRVVDSLLTEELASERPGWAADLLRQLDVVTARAARLHRKSLGALLRYQEGLAAEWLGRG